MVPRLLAVPATLALLAALAGCGSDDGSDTASDPTSPESSPTGPTTTCDYPDGGAASKEVSAPDTEAPASGEVAVTLTTSVGEIGATLDAEAAPCTVNSFTSLAGQGYFDGTTCHRLTTAGIFVLQCGDPSASGSGGPGYSFADELSGDETYPAGTLAMANAGPDTNGSQFFVVYDDTELPPSYTVFGTIDDAGLETVRQVAEDGTADGGPDGAPATEVAIESVSVG
ncbi:peptidylprolyl isomerase [Nocardioides euryhalodurans]|uniref:Peptidyl-prolyl cis-trans isomerase n=1 Tax=Nocardioides euryhalodurans TaxID=2518370 RepID=A0A4P7GHK8_9ACTN|nr:peptidylprolyl isomerase [Nocardioides euryhalodurans]QBR91224.1 peptidylprolyl isomerase [Nocardioides euryhalodurans]